MTNCSTNVCGTGSWSGPKPGDPDNSSVLTAVSEFGGIRLKWTMPNLNPFAVAHTRILRNTTANLSSATELVVYSGNVYFDATAAVDPIVTYYYWIQHVSINGTDLETLGPASGTAKPGIDEVIAKLANKIEFSSLASSLRSRVERITDLENGITQINQSIANDNQILSWELQAIKNDLTQAVAYVNNQLNIAADERVALVESINTLLAGFGDVNTVALREESRVRAEETGALFAEKIVKADLAGNVVGYGLSAYKDPSGNFSSDFRVAADTFSVAPPAIVQDTAPSSDNYNGKVWVDTSNASGPVPKWYNISTKAWQTTPVKASTPFYIQTTSRTVNGEVIPAGVYIDSAYISQLKANQIDTRGLTIRDNEGKIIFSAGTALDWNKVGGDGKPENGATRNVYVGDWSSTSVGYSIGDVVIESGYGWICVKNHISSTATKPPVYPNTNEYWKVHTIKGADGVSGNYTDYVFIRSANVPQTPTATTGTPAGWLDTPPTTGDGLLYMSKATKKADGTVVGSWTAPVRLDGSIGADGKYTKYQYAVSATTPDANTTWSDSATTPGSGSFLWMRSGVVTPPATAPTSWDTAVRISGEKGDAGASSISAVLSNETHLLPSSADGAVSSFVGSGTEVRVFEGSVQLGYDNAGTTAGKWKIVSTASNITCGNIPTLASEFVTVADHSNATNTTTTDAPYIDYEITGKSLNGTAFKIKKRQSFSKSKAGSKGSDATIYFVTANAPVIRKSAAGTFTPTSVTFTLKKAVGTTAPVDFAGYFKIARSTDGSTYPTTTEAGEVRSTVAETSKTFPVTSGAVSVRAMVYSDNNFATKLDEVVVPVVLDGTNGSPGSPGSPGTTYYTWIAYADDSSGTNISSSPTNKTYIGVATNKTTSTASSVASDYTWAKIVGNTGPRGPALVTLQPTDTVDDANFKLRGSLSDVFDGDQILKDAVIYTRKSASWPSTTAFKVNGDAVINGTISASKVNAAGLQVGTSGLIKSSGYPGYKLDWNSADPDNGVAGARFSIGANGYVHTDTLLNWGQIFTHSLGAKASVGSPVIYAENQFVDPKSTGYAILGKNTGAGEGVRGEAGTAGGASTNNHALRGVKKRSNGTFTGGIIGRANADYDFYADGDGNNYGPFTGSHDALVLPGFAGTIGDIVVDQSIVRRNGVSNSVSLVTQSSLPEQRGAVGVLCKLPGPLTKMSVYIEGMNEAGESILSPEFEADSLVYQSVILNGVGEGQINVCGEGGDLEIGDLIVTSSMPGKGMRQADDIVRSYTVAKCRENVTFSSPTEVKMVACIYLCG